MNHGLPKISASALDRPQKNPVLGIVIPCFNEEEVIPFLLGKLKKFADSIPNSVYFLLVDDGSSDQTFSLLKEASQEDPRFAVLQLSRNFGHQPAVSAGLAHIQGDVIAVIDADLQDPVENLSKMLLKWEEGFDVVYGIRKKRKGNIFLRMAYLIFYRFLKKIANIDLPVDAGDFSLMDRKVVDLINKMPEHNRFVRGLRGWVGFKQIGIPYDRLPRVAGSPKYFLTRLFHLALDGIFSFSTLPLRLATFMGIFSAFLGFLYLLYALFHAIFMGKTPPGWASLVIIILFLGGVQLFVIGIVGEYVGRIFDEVKRRPLYIIQHRSGWISQ